MNDTPRLVVCYLPHGQVQIFMTVRLFTQLVIQTLTDFIWQVLGTVSSQNTGEIFVMSLPLLSVDVPILCRVSENISQQAIKLYYNVCVALLFFRIHLLFLPAFINFSLWQIAAPCVQVFQEVWALCCIIFGE